MPNPKSVPELSVVFPVYNNRNTIEPLYSRITHSLEAANIQFELIFVDDGCPQKSFEIVDTLIKKDPRVNLLVMEHNIGQNNALLTGLSHATGKVIAAMDSDLQDPPEALPSLYSKLAQGYDVVFAGRKGFYEAKNRLFTSRIYKVLMHLCLGIPADAGLFFVAKKETVNEILSLRTSHSPVLPLIGVSGAKTISISTPRSTRASGFSSYSGFQRLMLGFNALFWIIGYRLSLFKPRSSVPVFPIKRKSGQIFSSSES